MKKCRFNNPVLLTSVLAGLVWMLAGLSVEAQVNYAISGSSAYVTNSPNAAGNIVITNIYDGYPVTSIEEEAFYNCTSLTSVAIPNSITTIGDYAFYNCFSQTNSTPPTIVIGGQYVIISPISGSQMFFRFTPQSR
jgi:BspA type Leucine rich repeat region (6 copies)